MPEDSLNVLYRSRDVPAGKILLAHLEKADHFFGL